MNLALRKPMTLAEFLEWEERQPLRYEFDGVGPVAMTGGTAGHTIIERNLAMAIGGAFAAIRAAITGTTSSFRSRKAISDIPTAWWFVRQSPERRTPFTTRSSSSKCSA